jgi:GNAT superfamily N-acetyltransferase
MKTHFRRYRGHEDFLLIRDFLKTNLYAFGKPVNWGIERWNWGRYHPSVYWADDPARTAACIAHFEGAVGIWENGRGDIMGVANTEAPVPNDEAFFQRSPGCDFLLEDMLDYAESALVDPVKKNLQVAIYEHDSALLALAAKRGYRKDPDSGNHWAEYTIGPTPALSMPEGFAVSSMAEGGNVAERCKVQGLGFNHPDPTVWNKPAEYREVQKAPDYRADLDLFTIAPNGEYASCCIVWYDDVNRTAFFEPVCTDARYRRRGLGRAVMMEGIRRVARLGAVRAFVNSSQEFYRCVGFAMELATFTWKKAFGAGGAPM